MRSSSRCAAALDACCSSVGDEAVRAPQERLGRAVELLAQPVRRLLADRPHPVVELDRAGLAQRASISRSIARSSCSTWRRSSSANASSTRVRASLSAPSTCSADACSCWRRRSLRSSIGAAPVVGLRSGARRAPVRERPARLASSSSRSRRAAARCSSIVAPSSVCLRGDLRLDLGDALAPGAARSAATAPSRARSARARGPPPTRAAAPRRAARPRRASSAMRSDSSRSRTASSPRRWSESRRSSAT